MAAGGLLFVRPRRGASGELLSKSGCGFSGVAVIEASRGCQWGRFCAKVVVAAAALLFLRPREAVAAAVLLFLRSPRGDNVCAFVQKWVWLQRRCCSYNL